MGCGCGGKRTGAGYTLTMPDGRKTTHGSRTEAQRTNVRQGGGGTVRPAAR